MAVLWTSAHGLTLQYVLACPQPLSLAREGVNKAPALECAYKRVRTRCIPFR